MFCEKCGTKLSIGSKFCMNCGSKVVTEETVQDASVREIAIQETAVREIAVQETAVSADTPVIEAEPAAADKVTLEIPDIQPAAAQYEIPGKEPIRDSKAQVVSEQPVRPGPILAQETAPQQTVPQQAQVQQKAPQQTLPLQAQVQQRAPQQTVPVPAQAGVSAEVQQIKPVQSAPVQNFKKQPDVSFQSAEADMRPDKVKPLQTWKFVGMLIITGIPIINLIMVLVWSFSGGFNKNTRSFARAVLILWIAGIVLLIITAIVNWAMIQYIWSSFSSVQSGLPPIY
jgi:hypothetical protein